MKKYLLRAKLEFGWDFKEEGRRQMLRRPERLPASIGPFTLDQSPNAEFYLADLGWIEPDRIRQDHPDWKFPVSLLYVECRVDVLEPVHPHTLADETLEALDSENRGLSFCPKSGLPS